MYEEDKNADPRVTLIDPDKNYYTIHDFYGKNDYGKKGHIGITHEKFPDEFEDLNQDDFIGWQIVITERQDRYTDDTETKASKVVGTEVQGDGWIIRYAT